MSDNEGAFVDEHGETDDYVEIANTAQLPASLAGYILRDGDGNLAHLPDVEIAPGERLVLFADGTPEQGPLHLPFRLSSRGDALELVTETGSAVDRIEIPQLRANHAYARIPDASSRLTVCRYATPGRANGDSCGAPSPPELGGDVTFSEYSWPEPWPQLPGPLVLGELALAPAGFVEVLNVADTPVELAAYALHLAPHAPGLAWPQLDAGVRVAWPDARSLAPGERIVVSIDDAQVAAIAADPAFEGVVTLFSADGSEVVDRVDFMRWPEGAALSRVPDAFGRLRFCAVHTPGEANVDCDPVPAREVGDRLRHLYTPGDFEALADGGTSLSARGVKYVLDMDAGDVVHLLSSRAYALHYTFVRERIDGEPPLDRCDSQQSAVFYRGWVDFSNAQYRVTEGRRFLLGTLNAHAGNGLRTMDFAVSDLISGEQMLRAFFTTMRHVPDPQVWSLRPSEPRQIEQMLTVDGRAPIVGMSAPFRGLRYQPLTEGVGYGVLRFVPAAELDSAALGRDVIVVTDDVPNDIPLVAGLITEAFQTPLAHVNVLSKGRGTPNMALRDARDDAALAPLLGELVRLEVSALGFSARAATPEEAEAFWQQRDPEGARVAPRSDLSVRGVQPLADASLDDLPAIGAKAAQLAELGRVAASCAGQTGVPVPVQAFALPLAHYAEHFEKSGGRALLDRYLRDPEFRTDAEARARGLARVQQAILATPVDRELLAELEAAVSMRYGARRVRLRSSSNTEDLPEFNGAGLYTSVSAAIADPERRFDDGLRIVWASLWSLRAYDERELARIDQTQVAMGVLVHEAFLSEKANAVAISRNLLDPTRSDVHYINAQIGEAGVANPAPGVVTEQLVHHVRRASGTADLEYQSRSSLSGDRDVLTPVEIDAISCQLQAIHRHFRARLDPLGDNRWFAIDIELKLIGDERRLLIKQARPYSFGRAEVPADCRET